MLFRPSLFHYSASPELPIPVDNDSRLELLRRENRPELPVEPTWPEAVKTALQTVIAERQNMDRLQSHGLAPTRSLLFVGPPGVGKTLSARWLARELGRPLLTLDLAAVMSSFLGRTGNNIRVVLDYARRRPSVLLLDEFDAIAKRRDDATEIGELKRLVTVLLQSVDDWPADGILLAATNHEKLLDPAVWRRFDHVVRFPLPGSADIEQLLNRLLDGRIAFKQREMEILVSIFHGRTFAEITREIKRMHRFAVLENLPHPYDFGIHIEGLAAHLPMNKRRQVAEELLAAGYSQRRISKLIGMSRDTLRKQSLGSTRNMSLPKKRGSFDK